MDLLRFATAGSVDDGKSTLIGRLLLDAKAIFEDQLEAVEATSLSRGYDYTDLALLTDGLRSEREQGITIDVAYRYFATPKRKFIIADTPGHTQYTRNMVTGASTANLAIILIDARKGVIEQTKRHSFIAHGLWPQYEKGGYPSRCATREKIDNATINAQLDIMPSIALVKHEWAVHGVCSGLGALAYFAELRQAFQKIVLPDFYKRPTGKLSRLPSQMKREIAAANPWLPESAMAVTCDGQFLKELRICLDRGFNPRPCSDEVARASCREREFIVRPVR